MGSEMCIRDSRQSVYTVPADGHRYGRVDMMKCPYHDTCADYGCPELCRCFCDSDDISYTGLHPKLIWERSMTLGRGNDRCDFCMKVR